MTPGAVLFDLDDTLYEHSTWLCGAWERVAEAAAEAGADRRRVLAELHAVASCGTARGRIIDRALERAGAGHIAIEPLVRAFRAHEAPLEPFTGVREGLVRLRGLVPVGLVTDGDPDIQKAKLRGLRMCGAFDTIVFSDDLGREYRKPHPAPFNAALEALGVGPDEAVYIGDNPRKDVSGAASARIRAIRVRTGEYKDVEDEPSPWRSVAGVARAIDLVIDDA